MKKLLLLASGLGMTLLSHAQWGGTNPLTTTGTNVKVGINNTTPSADLTIGTAGISTSSANTTKLSIQEENPWIELKDVSGYNQGAAGNIGAQVGIKLQTPTQTVELGNYSQGGAIGSVSSFKNSSNGMGYHIVGSNLWIGTSGGVSSSNSTLFWCNTNFKGSSSFETDNNQFRRIQTGIMNSSMANVVLSVNGSTTIAGNLTTSGTSTTTGAATVGGAFSAGTTNVNPATVVMTANGSATVTGTLQIGAKKPNYEAADANWKLAVDGKAYCHTLKVVAPQYWADFVFEKNYKLKSLSEVKKYINDNNHLPDVPSEKEVLNKGYDINEMDATLLRKIEELTLYVIQLEQQMNEMKKASVK
jgi:hypothetical protein